MRHIRGGLEYRLGLTVAVPPPPTQMASPSLRLRLRHRPEVHVGQRVDCGQSLSQPSDQRFGTYICPVPGRICGLSQSPKARFYDLMIEPTTSACQTQLDVVPPDTMQLESWIDAMGKTGPWGPGDGNVGLRIQLLSALLSSPKELWCVAADAFAPYPAQSSLVLGFAPQLVQGVRHLADLLGIAKPAILAGPGKMAMTALAPHARQQKVALHRVELKYPVGHWSLLLRYHSRVRQFLAPGSNPMQERVMMISAWTAIRLARWITHQQLDMVAPLFIAWPQPDSRMSMHWVFPGQSVWKLHPRLEAMQSSSHTKLVFGDPLQGRLDATLDHQGRLQSPVVPPDQRLLCLVDYRLPDQPQPCIACGWCAEVCPTSLQPAELYERCLAKPKKQQLQDQLTWCLDCGLCSHVCPSALPLAQTFRRIRLHAPLNPLATMLT